jgi:hypothetical protein
MQLWGLMVMKRMVMLSLQAILASRSTKPGPNGAAPHQEDGEGAADGGPGGCYKDGGNNMAPLAALGDSGENGGNYRASLTKPDYLDVPPAPGNGGNIAAEDMEAGYSNIFSQSLKLWSFKMMDAYR